MAAPKGDKAAFLPKRTYKDRMTMGSGKDPIKLFYFGAGHLNDRVGISPEMAVRLSGMTCGAPRSFARDFGSFAWPRKPPSIDR